MSWRDHIKVHPAADLFPMMSESELRELGEDIKENGQRVQVVLWKDPSPGGEYWLIDGRNRLDAMELAGLCVFDKIGRQRFFWRLMDGDPYEVVLSLNLLRRNLTDEQRRELIGKIIKAKPEASNVTIAKETGTSEPTVRRVRKGLSSSGDEVDQRTGRAAARPQAKKPRPKPEPVEYRATGSVEVGIEQRRAEYAALDAESTAVISVEDDLEGATPDEYRRAFLLRALDAIGFAVYSGEVDEEVIAAAERVVTHWQDFTQTLKARYGNKYQQTLVQSSAPDIPDDLSIPLPLRR